MTSYKSKAEECETVLCSILTARSKEGATVEEIRSKCSTHMW